MLFVYRSRLCYFQNFTFIYCVKELCCIPFTPQGALRSFFQKSSNIFSWYGGWEKAQQTFWVHIRLNFGSIIHGEVCIEHCKVSVSVCRCFGSIRHGEVCIERCKLTVNVCRCFAQLEVWWTISSIRSLFRSNFLSRGRI